MKQDQIEKFARKHGVYTGMGVYELSVEDLEALVKMAQDEALDRASKACRVAASGFASKSVFGMPENKNEWLAAEEAAKACAENIDSMKGGK